MAVLTQAGYKVRVERKRRNDRPAGTVIRQRPEAGDRAKPGTEVRLEVAEAEAARPVSVPDIVGDDRRRAVEKIRERRLEVGAVTEQASCEDAGKVISQTPPEDQRVPAGTSVSFVVAGPGDRPARVPRLIGLRQGDAEDAIRESRLRLGGRVNRRETDQQTPGTVLDQKPDANAVLAPGCPVEMTVAVPIPLVEVPNFIGMTEAEAKRRLPGGVGGVFAELRLGEVTYRDSAYGVESRAAAQVTTPTVTGQSPSEGAKVRRGTAVNLVVLRPRQGGGGTSGGTSDGPPPVQVPNLRGMTFQEAQRRLAAAGLSVGSVGEVQFRDAKEGTVVQQGLEPGAMVPRGTRVNLAVARRADTRKPVPNVVGMELRQAQATILQYGFKVGNVTIAEDGRASGRVIRQSPSGGTPAQPGTAVNLVVSGLR
jgi:serine/threonine-protein kinase